MSIDLPDSSPSRRGVVVANIRDAGWRRWFEVGPPVPEVGGAVAEMLAQDEAWQRPVLRLVALCGDLVVGRLRSRLWPNGGLRLGEVVTAEAVSSDPALARAIHMALISETADAAARDLRPAFLEALPAFDSLEPVLFAECLRAAGLELCRQAHLHVRQLGGEAPRPVLPPNGMRIERLQGARLVDSDLVRRGRVGTADRADAAGWEAPEAAHRVLSTLSPRGPCWVAHSAEGPCGYLWAMCEPPRSAVIIDVGVTVQARRRRLGSVLLARAIQDLRESGVARVLAMIDDENAPSIRLHAGAGFERLEGEFWTYRRRL